MNINDFSRLYRRKITEKRGATSPHKLKLGRVAAQRIRTLTHVTAENQTASFTKCRLAIDNGGVIHYLDELQVIAANELVVSRSDIILGEGDVFFAEFTGGAENDLLNMTCVGWEKDL